MATRAPRTERRADALTKARIVAAAIAILDEEGEGALTFRALSARLATGAGAIYWHVADKGELLAATTQDIVARVLRDAAADTAPRAAIRALALGLFDAIDAHPWVGAQLAREPWRAAMLEIFERLGRELGALGVAGPALFDAATALVNYILGAAGQNAANARQHPPGTDRETVLTAIAAQWSALDPAAYPFVRSIAAHLPTHDDRAQFLAGIDLVLGGLDKPGAGGARRARSNPDG